MNFKISGTPGQDLHEALASICEWLRPESYLEIGIDGGESMKTVIRSAPSLKRIVGCDIWNPAYCEHGLTSNSHIYDMVHGSEFAGEFHIIDGDSAVEIPKLTETFDLILVDGGHDFYHALGDFCSALRLANANGVIIVDDWNHYVYPEVKMALGFATPYAFLNGFELLEEESHRPANCIAFRRVK